jgi:hypothetical protein
VVFDPSLQPGDNREYVYYYDLATRRLKRIHRDKVGGEFSAVDEPEIRLGSIKEYKIWSASFGEAAIREVIAEAEKQEEP